MSSSPPNNNVRARHGVPSVRHGVPTMRQASNPCPVCGWYYRTGVHCRKCGRDCTTTDCIDLQGDPTLSREGRMPKGMKWNKKAHRATRI